MERPIILKAHEVRGILDGRQGQLRRIVRADFQHNEGVVISHKYPKKPFKFFCSLDGIETSHDYVVCPFGQVGDRLWCKETWSWKPYQGIFSVQDTQTLLPSDFRYKADGWSPSGKPSTHMPRWASRILLEIVSLRVERLQDITNAEAVAEGMPSNYYHQGRKLGDKYRTAEDHFCRVWESVYGAEKWAANPWVWVLTFKRVDAA